MHNKIDNLKEIKGLTGLRGYAALWVFFLYATYNWSGNSIGMNIARLGGLRVVIFLCYPALFYVMYIILDFIRIPLVIKVFYLHVLPEFIPYIYLCFYAY
ncbi:hypothetical protein UQ52_04270 [Rickettsia conorii subsp. raoultii]|uniref:Uncharacterized protein n=1 Tax=Rickettsia conorii subsp. raoultii TaxID=369822 RepID=A0A9N7GAI5_RICCR|nr:hypothetical protein UQ52_04270 [Rickettsia conorii subsp. raoultii]